MHQRMTRLRILGTLIAAAGIVLLGGCASHGHHQSSTSHASPQSGITVYGEIDTSVVRTR